MWGRSNTVIKYAALPSATDKSTVCIISYNPAFQAATATVLKLSTDLEAASEAAAI